MQNINKQKQQIITETDKRRQKHKNMNFKTYIRKRNERNNQKLKTLRKCMELYTCINDERHLSY